MRDCFGASDGKFIAKDFLRETIITNTRSHIYSHSQIGHKTHISHLISQLARQRDSETARQPSVGSGQKRRICPPLS